MSNMQEEKEKELVINNKIMISEKIYPKELKKGI